MILDLEIPMEASVETIVERLKTLPLDSLADVLSYVDFVAWRSHQSSLTNLGLTDSSLTSRSAEAKAIDRLPDEDNPKMWVTVSNPGDEIDITAYDRLRTLGYAIQVPLENS
jgi:hypothetical protein